jgi:pyruvate dehydrogenase E2 component (dihydrolipoamide acetyltransferase)
MPTPVVMPQMGESIAEGTIVRWIKKVGDAVDRDEPLLEISTDKVDAEIPAPAAGVLTEIRFQEGETVPVNSIVATIDQAVDQPPAAGPTSTAPVHATGEEPAAIGTVETGSEPQRPAQPVPMSRDAVEASLGAGARQAPASSSPGELRRQRSSPLVRRLAKEHNIDITQIPGSGVGGRVTKGDILGYLQGTQGRGREAAGEGLALPAGDFTAPPRAGVEVRPLSVMRRKIAEHMVLSRRTSAHVHSVFHVNFSAVDRIRQQKKGDYERVGARLTYMVFIVKAVTDALRRHPIVNASLDGDNAIYKKDINLGIAVALDTGLIVPVIKHADEKNMLGLSRAITDLADRARKKQLKPEDVLDGTFTITNPGQFGSQFGMPIINQPQVAILGVGTIEKRPVVVDDAIGIRTMAYLTLGFDHRLIDGAVADRFMSDVKEHIENFDIAQV